jgi:hypothetical protein
MNRIGDVMINMLVLSVADRGFEPRLGQPKTIQLVCVASLLRARLVGSESEYCVLVGLHVYIHGLLFQ